MNPKMRRFLEDNEDVTLLGFAWSLLWRFYLIIFATLFGIGFIIGFVGALFS